MANYFVSYAWANMARDGHGCISINAPNGIRNFDDIEATIAAIKAQYPDLDQVTIINWQRFEEDDHGEE